MISDERIDKSKGIDSNKGENSFTFRDSKFTFSKMHDL